MADISKALLVEGWMTPDELYWLANHAAEHQVVVEFGSYQGRSTRVMADHCPGTIYAVDNWNMLWEPNKTLAIFEENMEGTKARVVPVHQNHAEIQQWIYKIPTMVFIDGDHRYDYASRDIEFWLAWMAKPGWSAGMTLAWTTWIGRSVSAPRSRGSTEHHDLVRACLKGGNNEGDSNQFAFDSACFRLWSRSNSDSCSSSPRLERP
jgi:hypothetical protein